MTDFLNFYCNVLVRQTGSPHQIKIAELYSEYVKSQKNPEDTLLLIPELRYDGENKKHIYRLDYCIIDVDTSNKVGFEFSPWSTHGKLTGTRQKSQVEINKQASSNYAREMKKNRDYFFKYGISCITYTDKDLQDITMVFQNIVKFLRARETANELRVHSLSLIPSTFCNRLSASTLRNKLLKVGIDSIKY